jgi:hypothetical protein
MPPFERALCIIIVVVVRLTADVAGMAMNFRLNLPQIPAHGWCALPTALCRLLTEAVHPRRIPSTWQLLPPLHMLEPSLHLPAPIHHRQQSRQR